jgi:hypothetical protein
LLLSVLLTSVTTAGKAYPCRPFPFLLTSIHRLVPVGAPLGPGQVRNSNGPGLAAMVRASQQLTNEE